MVRRIEAGIITGEIVRATPISAPKRRIRGSRGIVNLYGPNWGTIRTGARVEAYFPRRLTVQGACDAELQTATTGGIGVNADSGDRRCSQH